MNQHLDFLFSSNCRVNQKENVQNTLAYWQQ